MWFLTACGSALEPIDDNLAGVGGEVVPGQYIVTLKQTAISGSSLDSIELAITRLSTDHRATPGRPLRLINGFVAVDLDEDDVAVLRADPRVAAVEPDVVMSVQSPQQNAVWNLDRIDQRALPLDGTFSYGSTGEGVTAYIVDTGIRSTHTEFAGRMLPGYTAFVDEYGSEDCHSHGTHVAGTVGGSVFGVAKDVRLVPVRVLNCSGSGTASGIIAGLDWIAATRRGPAVVNMSLGGGASAALDTAVRNLVASGVTVVVAAGNSNADACNYSPARVLEAMTTGATASNDSRASYSNFGTCVDLFAPGSSVRSALITSDTSSGLKTGTSMAAPHVAGVAALVLQGTPTASPAQVARAVIDAATGGAVTSIGSGSPNLLLFADPTTSAPAPIDEPTPPTEPAPEPDPDPEPEPEPQPDGPPCTDCDLYQGALAGSGDALIYPTSGSGAYTTRATSLHFAWLRGPSGTNFDLYLERQNNGGRWVVVARSEGTTANEEIAYGGKAGTYRWVVVSKEGAGDFDLYLNLP